MNIAVGNDHAGYEIKLVVLEWLKRKGYEVKNFGTDSPEAFIEGTNLVFTASGRSPPLVNLKVSDGRLTVSVDIELRIISGSWLNDPDAPALRLQNGTSGTATRDPEEEAGPLLAVVLLRFFQAQRFSQQRRLRHSCTQWIWPDVRF